MYLMYVDESGDCGMPSDGSPSRYFCLTGLVVHELRWWNTICDLVQFRHWLKKRYRVYLDDELHAAGMIGRPTALAVSLKVLKKHDRLAVVRNFADKIAQLSDINLINVVVDKTSGRVPNKNEVFRWAWYSLFQRFENTIRYGNFPGPKNPDDRGIVFSDNTDGSKLNDHLRTMRVRNRLKITLPNGGFVYRDEPIRAIVETPVLMDSRESYLVQAADCGAFLLKQSLQPNGYMKRHGGNAYFRRLEPVLCKHACNKDPLGVVRL